MLITYSWRDLESVDPHLHARYTPSQHWWLVIEEGCLDRMHEPPTNTYFSVFIERLHKPRFGCANLRLQDPSNLHDMVIRHRIYENDQQDATVYDNLLFLGRSTCFERYFRSSGASKLYYSFWYYTRNAGWPAATYVCNTRSCNTV
jgi:hypothetical protein